MSNRKQFVTIKGTKHYLDYRGNIVDKVGDIILPAWGIGYLGLEVETEGPSFEDIEPGIYSPYGNDGNRIIRKRLDGTWTTAEGTPANADLTVKIIDWHNEGILYRFNKGEATNA